MALLSHLTLTPPLLYVLHCITDMHNNQVLLIFPVGVVWGIHLVLTNLSFISFDAWRLNTSHVLSNAVFICEMVYFIAEYPSFQIYIYLLCTSSIFIFAPLSLFGFHKIHIIRIKVTFAATKEENLLVVLICPAYVFKPKKRLERSIMIHATEWCSMDDTIT